MDNKQNMAMEENVRELTDKELAQVTGGNGTNPMQALQGKCPGVQITSDGQPGENPSVRARGIGSFGSTAPLYVID